MSKLNILIVEDNYINALILKKALKDHNCIHVENDTGAFEALKNTQFDIILMDINLGNESKDGEAIMKEIRRNNQFSHIKIYAITSYAMPGDKQRFLEAGFDKYFPKPVSRKEILNDIEGSFFISS